MNRVVIRPIEHQWEARFLQDSIWSQQWAAWYHASYTTVGWPQVLADPLATSLPFQQVEVYRNGECIFCMPLARNELDEWANTDYRFPVPEGDLLERYAPSIEDLLEAAEIAASEGIVLTSPKC